MSKNIKKLSKFAFIRGKKFMPNNNKNKVQKKEKAVIINKKSFKHKCPLLQGAITTNKSDIHLSTTSITNTTYLIYS